MKLVHKSGSIKCNSDDPASYWGCTYESNYGNHDLMAIITNAKKEAILPTTTTTTTFIYTFFYYERVPFFKLI